MAWTTAELPPRYNAAADLLDQNLAAGRGLKVAIRTTEGAEVTYTVAATNDGGSQANDVVLLFRQPIEQTFLALAQ